jgi:DNA-directed RNA polymerase specialized sigma24 family protein
MFERDPRATERLDSLVRERIPATLRQLCRCLPPADREDALSDFFVPVWEALGRIAEREVGHPWAYLMMTMTHSSWATRRRWARQRAHEEPTNPADIDLPCGIEELEPLLNGWPIAEWGRTLTPSEREAWDVLRRQISENISRREVHRDMEHDRTTQNRIDKTIARGRRPGGFLDRLRKMLFGEEGVL